MAVTAQIGTVFVVNWSFEQWMKVSGLLESYGALTGLIVAMAFLFSDEYRWGWILMAAAPSAVSVVPFTTVLGGETVKSLFSTAANYLAALALVPILTWLLI